MRKEFFATSEFNNCLLFEYPRYFHNPINESQSDRFGNQSAQLPWTYSSVSDEQNSSYSKTHLDGIADENKKISVSS